MGRGDGVMLDTRVPSERGSRRWRAGGVEVLAMPRHRRGHRVLARLGRGLRAAHREGEKKSHRKNKHRTGCSEFQDWQSIGVFSSADAVGQRGVITRIASGCRPQQEASIRHAMSHLPARCRVFFAPDTDVKDHAGRYYKYANKPLGMMKWLQAGSVPPTATVALIDPDFFFLRPLWRGPASAIVASTA